MRHEVDMQAITYAHKDNGRHRLLPRPRNGESYAGQSEAKRHCRHGIWRNLSQTDAAPRAARETVFRHIHWETPVSGVGSPNFARNVSPATQRRDRKSVVEGKSVSGRADIGGGRCIKEQK